MKKLTSPLTDSYFITVFEGRNTDYSLSKSLDGVVLYNNSKNIETAFQHERFPEHKMFGMVSKMSEADAVKIMADAGLETPYINYMDRSKTFDSALSSFLSFLSSEKWDVSSENTWLIIPKPSKQLKGKKIVMEFSVGAMDFGNGNVKMDLDVFMSPITRLSKSVTFSMRIPKFLYDQCMTDAEIEARPKKDYIEAVTISGLHNAIENYVNQAHRIWKMENNAKNAKKVICINFSSSEQTTRDDWNHAYMGQQISTHFNFFVAYRSGGSRDMGREYFSYKKHQTGHGSTENGVSGIIDTELQGKRHWIGKKPSVVIDWTQEAEDFFNSLEGQFRGFSENLNKYLKDLNQDKVKELIQNKEQLKLS